MRSFVVDVNDREGFPIDFAIFFLSTIIPFIIKSSNTNINFMKSDYFLNNLDDSAGDTHDYNTSIVPG